MAGGLLNGQEAMQEELFKHGLEGASKGARTIVNVSRAGPGKIYDVGKIASAKDPWREGFGVVGSWIGGAANGALGTAAGGINAPVGTIIGSSFGEDVGKDIYDEHKAYIQKNIAAPVNGVIHRVHEGLDDNAAKVAATQRWMSQRNAALKPR